MLRPHSTYNPCHAAWCLPPILHGQIRAHMVGQDAAFAPKAAWPCFFVSIGRVTAHQLLNEEQATNEATAERGL